MATSTVAKLAGGTVLKMGDGASPEVFTTIPGVLTIGEIGEQGEFIEVTQIDDTSREYIAGMDSGQDIEITLNDLTGDSTQQTFITDANNRTLRNMQIVFPNGRTGTFTLALNGSRMAEPTPDEQIKIIVAAKQTGAVTWVLA